jgi:hypothetical protein
VPKFQLYTVDPETPVDKSVNVTPDPLQTLVLFTVKFASRAQPCRVIGRLTCEPEHPVGKDSITLTFPLVMPKLTVIVLLFGPVAPDVIVEPVGTAQVYPDPVVNATL